MSELRPNSTHENPGYGPEAYSFMPGNDGEDRIDLQKSKLPSAEDGLRGALKAIEDALALEQPRPLSPAELSRQGAYESRGWSRNVVNARRQMIDPNAPGVFVPAPTDGKLTKSWNAQYTNTPPERWRQPEAPKEYASVSVDEGIKRWASEPEANPAPWIDRLNGSSDTKTDMSDYELTGSSR